MLRRLIAAGTADVWLVPVTEHGPFGVEAARALRANRGALVARRAPEDAERSLVARAALIGLVASRTRSDLDVLTVAHDQHGRPTIAEYPGLSVSISHSGALVACAVSTRPIGVDVEQTGRPEADMALARRICAPEELSLIESAATSGGAASVLLRLWTRKEALAKALGTGLSFPLERLDVSRDVPCIDGVRARGMWVRDVAGAPPGYLAAAAGAGRGVRLRARLIEPAEGATAGGR